MTGRVWVVTHDPIPGVRETAMVFSSEDSAYRFQARLPEGINSVMQPAWIDPVVTVLV